MRRACPGTNVNVNTGGDDDDWETDADFEVKRFTRLSTRTNTYISRTTSEWNDFPPNIKDQSTVESFKTALELEDYLM
jgi:hypothetical protein